MKEATKMKYSKRSIRKQYLKSQVSCLCGFIVSELVAERCHTILQTFFWRRHVGVPPKDANVAAGNQQKHLELNDDEGTFFSLAN